MKCSTFKGVNIVEVQLSANDALLLVVDIQQLRPTYIQVLQLYKTVESLVLNCGEQVIAQFSVHVKSIVSANNSQGLLTYKRVKLDRVSNAPFSIEAIMLELRPLREHTTV